MSEEGLIIESPTAPILENSNSNPLLPRLSAPKGLPERPQWSRGQAAPLMSSSLSNSSKDAKERDRARNLGRGSGGRSRSRSPMRRSRSRSPIRKERDSFYTNGYRAPPPPSREPYRPPPPRRERSRERYRSRSPERRRSRSRDSRRSPIRRRSRSRSRSRSPRRRSYSRSISPARSRDGDHRMGRSSSRPRSIRRRSLSRSRSRSRSRSPSPNRNGGYNSGRSHPISKPPYRSLPIHPSLLPIKKPLPLAPGVTHGSNTPLGPRAFPNPQPPRVGEYANITRPRPSLPSTPSNPQYPARSPIRERQPSLSHSIVPPVSDSPAAIPTLVKDSIPTGPKGWNGGAPIIATSTYKNGPMAPKPKIIPPILTSQPLPFPPTQQRTVAEHLQHMAATKAAHQANQANGINLPPPVPPAPTRRTFSTPVQSAEEEEQKRLIVEAAIAKAQAVRAKLQAQELARFLPKVIMVKNLGIVVGSEYEVEIARQRYHRSALAAEHFKIVKLNEVTLLDIASQLAERDICHERVMSG